MEEQTIQAECPCCGKELLVEYRPAKWEGQKGKVIITHKKWTGLLEPKLKETLTGFDIKYNI